MISKESKNVARKVRHERVRSKIVGTSEVPRLCVFRSNTNIYAQIIDDSEGKTLVSASSLDKELNLKSNDIEAATKVGECLAKRAKKSGIQKVVFDRGGYMYHGKIKALAEAARNNGLEF